MDYNNIEELLEKYWQAETTLEEETRLKDFFCYGMVPPHLEQLKPIFQHLETRKNEKDIEILDENFDHEILNKLAKSEKRSWWNQYNQPLKIAASIIFIFLVGWSVYVNRPEAIDQSSHITYDDPEKAYQETKKALLMMSLNLNRGASHATNSLSKMDSAQNVIKDNLK